MRSIHVLQSHYNYYYNYIMGRIQRRTIKSQETEDALRKAVLAYKLAQDSGLGGNSIRDIADEYGVQYVTLWRRINGGKTRKEAHRKEQKLTAGEEKTLKDWVCDLDNRGFPPKVEMVSDMACTILLKRYDNAEEVDKKDLIGKHWITRFLNRHPELVTKFSTQVNKQRIAANSIKLLQRHFKDLKALMTRYHIDRAEQVYNMDEKGFLLGLASRCKVICRRGRKSPPLLQGM